MSEADTPPDWGEDDPGWYPDQITEQAIGGDRTASVQMWSRIHTGSIDESERLWLRHVAEAVLDAESKPAGVLRDRALVRALGLEGKMDAHRDLRDFAWGMRAFGGSRQWLVEKLSNPTAYELEHWPWRGRYRDMDPLDLAKLIDRELAKLPKPD